jgi:hypothetical protein
MTDFSPLNFIQSCKAQGLTDQHIMTAMAVLKRMDKPSEFLEDFISYENLGDAECAELAKKYCGGEMESTSGEKTGRQYTELFYQGAPVGVKYGMVTTTNYARRVKRVDPEYETAWVNTISEEAVEEAVDIMVDENQQFSTLQVKAEGPILEKREKMHYLQQMLDEQLTLSLAGKFDAARTVEVDELEFVEYGRHFGAAYPIPRDVVLAQDIHAALPDGYGDVPKESMQKGEFPYVDEEDQVATLMARGIKNFSTMNHQLAVKLSKGFVAEGPWYMCSLPTPGLNPKAYAGAPAAFSGVLPKGRQPRQEIEQHKPKYITKIPIPILKAYKLLQSGPSKTFYYDPKNRKSFFQHLKSVGVVSGGKKKVQDIAARVEVLVPQVPIPRPIESPPASRRSDLAELVLAIIRNKRDKMYLFQNKLASQEALNAFPRMIGTGKSRFHTGFRDSLDEFTDVDSLVKALCHHVHIRLRNEHKHIEHEIVLVAAVNIVSMIKLDSNDNVFRN